MKKQYNTLDTFVIYVNKKSKEDIRDCQKFLKEATRFQLKMKNQIGSNVPVYLITKGQGNPWWPKKTICPCTISRILNQVDEKCFPYLKEIFQKEGININQEDFNKIKNQAHRDCQEKSDPEDRDGKITVTEFNESSYKKFNKNIGDRLRFNLKELTIKSERNEPHPTQRHKNKLRQLREGLADAINNIDYFNEEEFENKFGVVYESLKNTDHTSQIIEHYNLEEHLIDKEYKRASWGAYFKASSNRKEYIEIYLDPIFTFSQKTGLDPYLMYRKVLIHELAHAYHHKGIDANGNIWDDFWKKPKKHSKRAEDNIIEGLAQWHTFHYMYELDVNEHRSKSIYCKQLTHPPVFDNIYTMLTAGFYQSSEYHYYKKWLTYSYENIRNAIMLSRINSQLIFENDFDNELSTKHQEGH